MSGDNSALQAEENLYEFDVNFQLKILALCVQDINFMSTLALEVIKPKYFETKTMRTVCTWIFQYHSAYNKTPTMDFFVNQAKKQYDANRFSVDEHGEALEICGAIATMDLDDVDYIRDQVIEFSKHQGVKEAIQKAISDYTKREYDKIPAYFEKATTIGVGLDMGTSLGAITNLPDTLRNKYNPDKLIKFGVSAVDKFLNGGMAEGELHVVVGPPGAGKSKLLSIVAANNIFEGKKVVYITFELSEEDVLTNIAHRVTGMKYHEIIDPAKFEYYTERIEKLSKMKDNFHVKYWANKTVSAVHVRSYITKLKTMYGFDPDLIVLDYADLMLGTSTSQSLYEDGGNIYYDLSYLADYFKCPVLTGSQPKVYQWDGTKLIDMEHLADSSRKAHVAYSIITMNQTFAESRTNRMRLFGAKVRRGINREVAWCLFDKSTCQMSESSEKWSIEEKEDEE